MQRTADSFKFPQFFGGEIFKNSFPTDIQISPSGNPMLIPGPGCSLNGLGHVIQSIHEKQFYLREGQKAGDKIGKRFLFSYI